MADSKYRTLAEQVRARQNPENLSFTKSFSDELASISYSDVLYYVKLAMNGVNPDYTQRSKDAGEQVKRHLLNGGLADVTFQYQGSVMTNTHIKGYSDIDLLAISQKFHTVPLYEINGILNDYSRKQHYNTTQIDRLLAEQRNSSYLGTSSDDLLKLRLDSEGILSKIYSIINKAKPKSIKINNTNLKREVDIVIANWYDDVRSIINDRGDNRGIQIYNKDKHDVGTPDYPFLSIQRINTKSAETDGRLKKMIRFLKNLKAKSTLSIDLNSFEFNAICFDISKDKYQALPYYGLVAVIYQQLGSLCSNQAVSDALLSVDECEYVFRGKPQKIAELKNLLIEVESVYNDLKIVL